MKKQRDFSLDRLFKREIEERGTLSDSTDHREGEERSCSPDAGGRGTSHEPIRDFRRARGREPTRSTDRREVEVRSRAKIGSRGEGIFT